MLLDFELLMHSVQPWRTIMLEVRQAMLVSKDSFVKQFIALGGCFLFPGLVFIKRMGMQAGNIWRQFWIRIYSTRMTAPSSILHPVSGACDVLLSIEVICASLGNGEGEMQFGASEYDVDPTAQSGSLLSQWRGTEGEGFGIVHLRCGRFLGREWVDVGPPVCSQWLMVL